MISLKRNIGITFFGTLVFSLSQWGIISAIAKIGGAEKVGIYALALAVVSPVFSLANLNLRSVQSTDIHRQYTFIQYRNLRLLTSFTALMVIAIILCMVDYRSDIEVFICPFLIDHSKIEKEFSRKVYTRLVNFLTDLNRNYVKPNKRNKGIQFLSHLHEPNEIHFG